MLLIGLTGGIASGKSMVAEEFSACGAKIIDADEIVKGLYKKKPVQRLLAKNFGKGALKKNNAVDRNSLASAVFNSKKKLRRLNALVHPLVIRGVKRSVKLLGKRNSLVVVVAPLLFEAKMQGLFDAIIVVKCRRSQQAERLMKCRGVSLSFAKKIISAQLPLRKKLKFADYVIDSSGSKKKARAAARNLCKKLRKLSG
ncbi:MAG: dephospho-CoA kinase [Candidatus Diapherotrites archaeon]